MYEFSSTESDWPVIELPLDLRLQVVHVIRVRLDIPAYELANLAGCLSADELARADRFRFDEPRRRFVTCRSALRQLLGNACGIAPQDVVLRYGPHGKPAISFADLGTITPKIEFSVSHSGDLGLIAVTVESPVGIDVEELNSNVKILKLAERFFSASEAEDLRNLKVEKQLAGFYRGWTCKEAYIKATGRGLSLSLSSFRVLIDPDHPASLVQVNDQPDEPLHWTTSSLEVAPDYAAAVMVSQPNCRIQKWDWRFA
jgi:4'-phosphopantetheinyl transferase